MKSALKTFSLLALGLAVGIGATWAVMHWDILDRLGPAAAEDAAAGEMLYTCAMHPHILETEPGNCPICNMRLTPVRNPAATPVAAAPETPAGEREILYWRAPMDPNYISDEPGKSPMGMDLIPVYAEEQPGPANVVRVDPGFVQNFAVRTAVAERGAIPIDIRTVGVLSHNEDSVRAVSTKYEGWIERSYYNTIGEHVHAGTPMFEIYSPALVTTQQEYLSAIAFARRLEESGAYPEALDRARSLAAAARERLRYWDVSDAQIDEIEQSNQPRRMLTVTAPASGHLMSKAVGALEGLHVTPGMTILTLADHTKLWLEVEIYEQDVRHVREGTQVRLSVDAVPGVRRGTVAFFGPAVDPQTRTLSAFVEVANTDLKLRPGMYAEAVIQPPAPSNVVRVPEEAVIHSGERSVVIVQLSPSEFQPREVEVGNIGGGFQEIRSGIRAGERVVVSSQFLIDSESNLRAALMQLLGPNAAGAPEAQDD